MQKVFLSYSRENLDDVQQIANVLCAGGIRIWQDLNSLATGNTDKQIRRAILNECSAFFLYGTEESITSDFIRNNEMPVAFEKSCKDKNFQIIPLINMPREKADEAFKDILRGDISRYNGVIMKTGDTILEASQQIKILILKSLIKFQENHDFIITLMTYSETPGDILPHLDLDWSRLQFSKPITSNETWETYLLPSLVDIKDALLSSGIKNIRIYSKAILSAGFAFGYVFRRETGFHLKIEQADQYWTTVLRPSKYSGFNIFAESLNTGSKNLMVNLSITNSVGRDIGEYLKRSGISFRAELRVEPKAGPSRDSVPDSETASAIAWELGNKIRQLKGEYTITDVHIFSAMPLGLAYLIGAELNACGKIHLYEFDRTNSIYFPSWTLTGNY